MKELVDAFYRDRSIVSHQIGSYNDFLERRIQNIVDSTIIGQEEEMEKGFIYPEIEDYKIRFGKISVGLPEVKEADGTIRPLTPMEARLRDLTYEAPIELEFIPVINEVEYEPETVKIGQLPIMIKSKRCNISKKSVEDKKGHSLEPAEYVIELQKLQEDPLDPGGYFISNGTERVLITVEDLAPNRVLVEKSSRYGRDVEVAKVFSQREGYRALTVVEKRKDGMLMVSLPTTYGQIPLMILLRSLGMENDEEIVDIICVDPKMRPFIMANIEECAKEYGITSKDEAVAYLGKKFAGGQAKEYRIKRVETIMDRHLLAHLGNSPDDRLTKAIFMARMGMAVLELALDKREPDDKDHYANKRLKLAGDLMEDLFRVAFTALCKDLKYQIERVHAKGKEIKIASSLRADVLSQRIHHALATGNWVGGRAGISQLLDRTSNLAVLSHLRRVTSPLTRSQPHFEARDLHSTQWGRLCPNETPEGPNCGLVKNLALTVEISEGFPEKEVETVLKDLGIKEITKKMTGARVYLNGDLIGMHTDGVQLVQKLRERRRKGMLHQEINVMYNDEANDVIVNCDCGRLRRPLAVVEKGKFLLDDKNLQELKEGKKTWSDLINEGLVEYVDAEEEENTLIALKQENITPDHTHMELDAMCILGIGASLVPYPEHNSSPRITMGAGMGKQSLGFSAANYRIRPDTRGHLLHYPMTPLVQTHPIKYINFRERPAGQNFIVAVASFQGYNMEDALVMSKASIERGMARSTFNRTYRSEEKRYPGGQEDHFEIPNPDCRGVRSEDAYNTLSEDGLISPESGVGGGNVLIGKTSPPRFLEEPTDFLTPQKRRETSVTVQRGEGGTVDKVMLSESVNGSRMVKIKVREQRIPEYGDKFASKHGQKGVIGYIVPQENLPFTEKGVTPDLIINPHAIPSRMTIAHVLEMIGGKVGALEGRTVEGTAFSGEPEEVLRNALVKNGFKHNGKEILFDGATGKPLECDVFVGRAREGGLRFGEMERDCLIGHGASMVIKDRLLDESDLTTKYICDTCGHIAMIDRHGRLQCPICGDKADISPVQMSYAFKLLIDELKSLVVVPRIKLETLV